MQNLSAGSWRRRECAETFPVDPGLPSAERSEAQTASRPEFPAIEFFEIEKAPLRILVPPELDKHYVIGADVAINVPDGCYSCAQVLEYEHAEQVAVWHGRCDPDVFGHELNLLGHFYSQAFIAVEANPGGGGETVLKVLYRDHNYYNLYFRQRSGTMTEKVSFDRPGWFTTSRTKPVMYTELAMALRKPDSDEAPDLILHDEFTIRELGRILYDPQRRGQDAYGAKRPDHDDYSDALAIAWQARKQFFPPVKPDRLAAYNEIAEELGMRARVDKDDEEEMDDMERWCMS